MPITISGSTGIAGVDGSAGTPSVQGADTNTGMFFPAADTIAFAEGGVEVMRIDSSGNVGIGTTSPTVYGTYRTLEVRGAGGGLLQIGTGATTAAYLYQDGTNSGFNNIANGVMTFGTNNTERMRIDSSGNVGIGVQTASARLELAKSGGVALRLNDLSTNYWEISNDSNLIFNRGGTERARIDSSGNFLINTTDTTLYNNTSGYGVCYRVNASFDVLSTSDNAVILNRTGTDGGIEEFRKSGTIVGSISVTGSATAYNTSSDYRLKENVQPMSNGLATVSALKPVRYDWVRDRSVGEGFIAHELQEIIPQAVTGDKDAVNADGSIKPQGVDYSKIVVHLVAAIQEQQSQIEELKAKVAALESK
jgi:hypothetical protein